MNAEPSPIRVAIGLSTGGPASSAATLTSEPGRPPIFHSPLIDIHEGPDGLILEADLPGATERSLAVQLEDNVLSLQAFVEPPVTESVKPVHQEYRVGGGFQRSFILSDEVDRGKITAELKNGVLRLTLPKADRLQTRRIEIKAR